MSEKAKVIVADDNGMTRDMIHQALEALEEVRVVAQARNGQETVELVKKHEPDILILDLVMPVLDGLGVLEEISRQPGKQPDVLVLTAMGSDDVVREAMRYRVRYYMVKPFETDQICRRVREIIQVNRSGPAAGYTAPMAGRARTLDEEIIAVFLTMGIPAHIKGYHYLREAVKMVMENKQLIGSITKELYPGVAERCDTSPSKVERAIRHAIDVAWTKGRIDNINRVIGYDIYTLHNKPTNGEFIALLADKLSMEHPA